MSTDTHTFVLTPYAATAMVRAIEGRVTRVAGGFQVNYRLDADTTRLRLPAPAVARFADELWRHTCFEAFVALRGAHDYLEFNFSPSGEWAAYAFARYRERIPAAELETTAPRISSRGSGDSLELEAIVELPPSYQRVPLRLGLSAVVEAADGALSYWALAHPDTKPDFHHPDAFVLEFDEIRH